jgi:hypothetical protein
MLSNKIKSVLGGGSDSEDSFAAQPLKAGQISLVAYRFECLSRRLLQIRIVGALGSFDQGKDGRL